MKQNKHTMVTKVANLRIIILNNNEDKTTNNFNN